MNRLLLYLSVLFIYFLGAQPLWALAAPSHLERELVYAKFMAGDRDLSEESFLEHWDHFYDHQDPNALKLQSFIGFLSKQNRLSDLQVVFRVLLRADRQVSLDIFKECLKSVQYEHLWLIEDLLPGDSHPFLSQLDEIRKAQSPKVLEQAPPIFARELSHSVKSKMRSDLIGLIERQNNQELIQRINDLRHDPFELWHDYIQRFHYTLLDAEKLLWTLDHMNIYGNEYHRATYVFRMSSRTEVFRKLINYGFPFEQIKAMDEYYKGDKIALLNNVLTVFEQQYDILQRESRLKEFFNDVQKRFDGQIGSDAIVFLCLVETSFKEAFAENIDDYLAVYRGDILELKDLKLFCQSLSKQGDDQRLAYWQTFWSFEDEELEHLFEQDEYFFDDDGFGRFASLSDGAPILKFIQRYWEFKEKIPLKLREDFRKLFVNGWPWSSKDYEGLSLWIEHIGRYDVSKSNVQSLFDNKDQWLDFLESVGDKRTDFIEYVLFVLNSKFTTTGQILLLTMLKPWIGRVSLETFWELILALNPYVFDDDLDDEEWVNEGQLITERPNPDPLSFELLQQYLQEFQELSVEDQDLMLQWDLLSFLNSRRTHYYDMSTLIEIFKILKIHGWTKPLGGDFGDALVRFVDSMSLQGFSDEVIGQVLSMVIETLQGEEEGVRKVFWKELFEHWMPLGYSQDDLWEILPLLEQLMQNSPPQVHGIIHNLGHFKSSMTPEERASSIAILLSDDQLRKYWADADSQDFWTTLTVADFFEVTYWIHDHHFPIDFLARLYEIPQYHGEEEIRLVESELEWVSAFVEKQFQGNSSSLEAILNFYLWWKKALWEEEPFSQGESPAFFQFEDFQKVLEGFLWTGQTDKNCDYLQNVLDLYMQNSEFAGQVVSLMSPWLDYLLGVEKWNYLDIVTTMIYGNYADFLLAEDDDTDLRQKLLAMNPEVEWSPKMAKQAFAHLSLVLDYLNLRSLFPKDLKGHFKEQLKELLSGDSGDLNVKKIQREMFTAWIYVLLHQSETFDLSPEEIINAAQIKYQKLDLSESFLTGPLQTFVQRFSYADFNKEELQNIVIPLVGYFFSVRATSWEQRLKALNEKILALPKNHQEIQTLHASGYADLWRKESVLNVYSNRQKKQRDQDFLKIVDQHWGEFIDIDQGLRDKVQGLQDIEYLYDDIQQNNDIEDLMQVRLESVTDKLLEILRSLELEQNTDVPIDEWKQRVRVVKDNIVQAYQDFYEKKSQSAEDLQQFQIRLLNSFWENIHACQSSIPGCYAPTGYHAEKPLLNAVQVDSGMISVRLKGKEIENSEFKLLDQGIYIYPAYAMVHHWDAEHLWVALYQKLLKEQLVPGVILSEGAPAYEFLKKHLPNDAFLAGDRTVDFRRTIFENAYYDDHYKDSDDYILKSGTLILKLEHLHLIPGLDLMTEQEYEQNVQAEKDRQAQIKKRVGEAVKDLSHMIGNDPYLKNFPQIKWANFLIGSFKPALEDLVQGNEVSLEGLKERLRGSLQKVLQKHKDLFVEQEGVDALMQIWRDLAPKVEAKLRLEDLEAQQKSREKIAQST